MVRRLISIVGVSVIVGASLVAAAPAKKKAPTPVAPAKDPAPAKGSAAGSAAGKGSGSAAGGAGGAGSGSAAGGGSGDAGSAVAPIEDTPPSDMEGKDENPDNPKGVGNETKVETAAPVAKRPAGYPIEEVMRPITLPANMAEVSIDPHFQASPFAESDTLHARYGITKQVQFGITYLYGGVYDRHIVDTASPKSYGFHTGKAFGVDVTILLQNWLAVRIGVPVYIEPVGVGLQLGAPIKFTFGDKYAIGGFDDLLNIRIKRFAPSYYQELYNAQAAQNDSTNTQQSYGRLRFSLFGEYQQSPQLALIGRIGIDNNLGYASGNGGAGTDTNAGTQTFIRFGIQYAVRKFFDAGINVGWDDLSVLGSFGPQAHLALRI